MEQNEEVKAKPMLFTSLTNTKSENSEVKVVKSASKSSRGSGLHNKKLAVLYDNPNFIHHDLGKGVTIVLTKDPEEDYSSLVSLHSLLEFNKKKPNNIVGIIPELFNAFVDDINNTINPYVKKGQIVKSVSKFERGNFKQPRKVEDVYLKSLNNMTVVIAKLEDDSIHISYTLEICK